jgi:murein L,D-transpeptidase YafK
MHRFSRIRHAFAFAAAGLATLALASCSDYASNIPKQIRPLPSELKTQIANLGMKETAPILVRIFKEESVFEVWKLQKASGRYALLKTYDICKWSGDLGPKKVEGDRQAPEGFYTITPAQMNPKSSYYLSFNLGYPNEYDRSLGRTGTHLMVHGACSSRGCYSMDDEQIQEIYTLARLAFQGGQRSFQVQAYPFRMTPENMAKHRGDDDMPFWKMLKEGYDHFEVLKQPPKIDVCSQRYVFNSVPQPGVTFSATGACPPMSVPDEIRVAVAEKEAQDEAATKVIVAELEAQEKIAREEALKVDAAIMLADVSAIPDPNAPEPAPMSVAAAPLTLEPATTASVTATAVPAGPPSELAASARSTPDETATAAAASAGATSVATAYVQPEPEKSGIGGFFSKVIDKIDQVNPF